MTRNSLNDPTAVVLTQLITRVAARDDPALRMLYDLTSSRLLLVALRILRRQELAEEVLQEAFINVWRFASEYKSNVSAPMVWMAVIVRNRTFDYLRQRKSISEPEIEWYDALDDVMVTETAGPYDLAVANQEARHLTRCMSRLDANQRRAVELTYFFDLSHSEVAVVMDAPLGTVKAWIRRGTARLKVGLEMPEQFVGASTSLEEIG